MIQSFQSGNCDWEPLYEAALLETDLTKLPERITTAEWGAARDEVFPVDVVVEAMDRQGLLRDISEVFSREKINVTAVNTQSRNLAARMSFTLEVRGVDELKRALSLVKDVPGVLSAARR